MVRATIGRERSEQSTMAQFQDTTAADKFRRKRNWTEEECLVLAEGIGDRKRIIKGKFGPGNTSDMKKQAWAEIANAVNAASSHGCRTPDDCERKWYAIQSKGRELVAKDNKYSAGTGKNCLNVV